MLESEDAPFDLELELLRASYGDELETCSSPDYSLKFYASPYVAARRDRVFVSVIALVRIPSGYPGEPAEFTIHESRGLDDEQLANLANSLLRKATDAACHGELHVSPMLEEISEFLTKHNKPNPCPVCLDPVDTGTSGDRSMIVLKPCLHVLHRSCFLSYRQHLQERRREKEALLIQREGPARAARLAEIGWATCPVCRVEVKLESADRQAGMICDAS